MQRFQRGSSSVVPVSAERSANHSFTYGDDSVGAASNSTRTLRYAFHVSSGTAAIRLSMACTKRVWRTLTAPAANPRPSRYAAQSKRGASATSASHSRRL